MNGVRLKSIFAVSTIVLFATTASTDCNCNDAPPEPPALECGKGAGSSASADTTTPVILKTQAIQNFL